MARRTTKHACCIGTLMLLAACGGRVSITADQATSSPAALEQRSLIIDTDMATDDWMAIAYLLQRPELDVKAITVTGTGEAHCEPGIQNALKLVAMAGEQPIPMACGRETPLSGDHAFPSGWRDFVDSLAGIELPDGNNPIAPTQAVDLMSSILHGSDTGVEILALGPLTNMAELVQDDPTVIEHIHMVTIMGGAVHVPGNLPPDVPDNAAAEWNIYVDPTAANILFRSNVPITLVPLDASNYARISMEFLEELGDQKTTAEADFVFNVLYSAEGFIQTGEYYFWDPLAAALFVDDSLGTFESDPICVVEQEGPDSGQTIVQEGCPVLTVAVSADNGQFEREFIDTLNNP